VLAIDPVPIVGDRPETGLRIAIERPPSPGAPPLTYMGAVHAPGASHAVEVHVGEDGEVTVRFLEAPPADEAALADRVRLVVRTVLRRAQGDGRPAPLRIHRWREA
jgi:hypothetical protein